MRIWNNARMLELGKRRIGQDIASKVLYNLIQLLEVKGIVHNGQHESAMVFFLEAL